MNVWRPINGPYGPGFINAVSGEFMAPSQRYIELTRDGWVWRLDRLTDTITRLRKAPGGCCG